MRTNEMGYNIVKLSSQWEISECNALLSSFSFSQTLMSALAVSGQIYVC